MASEIVYDTWLWGDGEEMLWGDDVPIIMRHEITDLAFLQWLRDQSARVTLLAEAKFAYQSSGVPAEGTLYFSDRPYVSETPQPYVAAIEGAPTLERALDVRQLGGRGSASLGSLSLANADGAQDYLLRYIVDGRDISFFLGDPTWERTQFRQIGMGVLVGARADDDSRLTFTLRDRNRLLDATIIGDEMTTGPNAGKPKPIILGQVNNFDLTPYLYDTAGPSYYFNNYAMDDSLAFADVLVRDAGVSLVNAGFSGTNAAITANATTNLISKTGHGQLENNVVRFSGTTPFAGLSLEQQYWVIADGLTADDFKVSLTRGGSAVDITGTTFSGTLAVSSRRYYVDTAAASITLSADPEGRVTADILAQGASGDAAIQYVPHAGFRYILDTWTLLTSADRDTAAFASLVAAEQSAGTRWGMAILDRTNVLDVLDAIAVATNSWYGWNASGLLSVGKLDLANLDSATATETITEDDIVGDPSYSNESVTFGRLIVDANRNVVTQTDGLADTVSAEDRSKWAQQHQTRVKSTDAAGEQYLADWWNYHRLAIDSSPLATAFVGTESVVQDYCDERSELFAPFTGVFSCTVGIDKYALNPGGCVFVTYSRYSLDAGKNFRVASVRLRPSEKLVDLVLIRKNVPNWDALGVGVGVPGAPTIGTATGANAKAYVAFTAPASNGGATITGYTATSSPGGFTGTGTTSPILVSGLTNGVGYTFTVKATNSAGDSAASSASNSVTPASTVPDAPTAVSASAGTGQATVTFTAPVDNGGSAILDYTATSSPGGLTATGASSPLTVTGLSGGTSYTFTVTARNANGNSVASAASNSVTPSVRQIALTISANTSNYNIFTQAGSPTDTVDVTVTVNSGITVTGSGGQPAMRTGTGWVAGSTIKVVATGHVDGQSGAAGAGGWWSGTTPLVGNGGTGYIAIEMNLDVTIDVTSGRVFGGGGGGGGGGATAYTVGDYEDVYYLDGGDGDGSAGQSGYGGAYGGIGGQIYGPGLVGENGGIGSIGTNSGGILGPTGSGGAVGFAVKKNGYTVTWIGYDAARVKGDVA